MPFSELKTLFLPTVVFLFLLRRWWKRHCRGRFPLTGCHVMVTGGTGEGGLGMALAIEARDRGAAKVVITGRKKEQLDAARVMVEQNSRGNGQVLAFEVDLDWPSERIESAVETIWTGVGRVDVLINNAGCSYRGKILDTKPDVHHKLMQANYFGHVHLVTAMSRLMIKSSSEAPCEPCIVGISSLQGKLSIPYRSAYSASKHALQAFLDCLRAELASSRIRVLCVSPGYIKTNLSLNALRDTGAAHASLDATTASGMTPQLAASRVLDGVQSGESELVLASFTHSLVIKMRAVFPNLYFWAMRRRAASSSPY